ncbi:STAS domain-containing protein [Streptomyces sp. H27-H1]|uniref:STAS domain-containing protein n=1 Tax=Streptomyces sp. H27-H1 TaxID=2996461 RepID=UPI002271BEAF|nr:STAS domain-containing protein [Streptomyces sp. H27-H1]MCY0929026.1 STAS domain-containing protein [Streptomyces sp. H27-H1]
MAEPLDRAAGKDIAVQVLDHAVVIRPTGEIDLETASLLRLALGDALTHASPAKPVVVDCSRLTFCDSSALNTLLAARRTAQATDTVIRLAAPNHQLQRLLEMTGTLPLFPLDQDASAAGHLSQGCTDGPTQ